MMFSPIAFFVSLCLMSVTCDDDMEFNWHFPGSNSDSKESNPFGHYFNFPDIYRHNNLQQQHLLNYQHQQQQHLFNQRQHQLQAHQQNPYGQTAYQLFQNHGRNSPGNHVNPFAALGQLITMATGGDKDDSHETFQNLMDIVKTHAGDDSSEEKGHMVNPPSAGGVQISGFRKHGSESAGQSVHLNGDGKRSDESSEETKGHDADDDSHRGSEENGGSSERRHTRGPSSASTSASAPTTTTSRPTTPKITTGSTRQTSTISTTEKPEIPDICKNGQVVNGVSYQSHWSDCSKFIQCHFLPDGNVHVAMKSCQHGTYWDQASLTCNHGNAVNCPHDLCRKEGFDRYPSLTNCRGYWICQNGKSEGYCCPPQHSYDVITSGCVPNALCADVCSPVNILNVCDRRAVPGRPLVYEQDVPGKGWVQMSCAQGSAFIAHECRCSWSAEINQTEILCQPELYIPFNGDIRDESGNSNYLQVDGVKVVDGAGYFDGKSLIRVPTFSNMHFGDTFIVKLRYKEEGGSMGSGQPQALVANGDCNKPSSMYMVTGQGRMDVGLRSGKGQNVSVSVPSNGSGWKDAVLMADNNLLHGTVNGVTYQTLFTGSIEPSKCALQIGRGTDFKPFYGYMDDITVYLCRPKGF